MDSGTKTINDWERLQDTAARVRLEAMRAEIALGFSFCKLVDTEREFGEAKTGTDRENTAHSWVKYEEKSRHADVHRLDVPDLILKPAELSGSHARIYYFGDHFETE